MITSMIRQFCRTVFLRIPAIRRLYDSLENLRCVTNQLERQAEVLQGRLLESESRNALIPGLEQQAEILQGRLLESESRNALIPGLVQQAEVLQGRLLESENRNALIPGLEHRLANKEAKLRSLKKSVSELELAQIGLEEQLGEIAFAEERLDLLQRGKANSSHTQESLINGGKRRLTIGILGNVNNYPLMLAEGFRRLGHEVRLVINRKNALHRPESKYPEWQNNYPEWVLDCSALSEEALMSNSAPLFSKVINYFFDQADLVILNDFCPALAKLLPKPQMAFLTGSDLTYYANYHSLDLRTATWDLEYKKSPQGRRLINQFANFVAQQRDGILSADVVSFGVRGLIPEGDELLDSIGVADSRRMMIMLSDTNNLKFCPPSENTNLRIFNGARVAWLQSQDKKFSMQDLKGTDVLLQGFAMYCQSGGQGELRMVQKGHDVENAYDLCIELGIDSRVVWLNEMDLHQYDEEVRLSDLVCDQFGQSFPGMVTSHAYALGRPVLANFRNEVFARNLSKPLPGFQAATANEVAEQLLALDADRKAIQAMGKKSRQYAEKYMSPESMAEQVLIRAGLNKKG
jgi:hypothetical protein